MQMFVGYEYALLHNGVPHCNHSAPLIPLAAYAFKEVGGYI